MRRAEFKRLKEAGQLTILFHNAETGVVTGVIRATRVQVTLRPDLPGLPVTND